MSHWGSIEVNVLWVDDSLRGQGYWAKLLSQIENIAAAKGCHSVELNTFGFQAPSFYEKQGYKLCGIYENVPKGYNRYFYLKYLAE